MKTLFLKMVAGSLALGMMIGNVNAKDLDPTGRWQSDTGESRYDVVLCGDGTQLCGKVVWLRADASTPETRKYLGTDLVTGAKRSGPNQWRGTLNVLGHSLSGTITLTDPKTIALEGCVFVFCKTFHLLKIAAK